MPPPPTLASVRLSLHTRCTPPKVHARPADSFAKTSELPEILEGLNAQKQALEENKAKLETLIEELPMRIISLERQQILRLTLQNLALQVSRAEHELQMHTLHRVLAPLYSTQGAGPATALTGIDATAMRKLLTTCSTDHGGGCDLLRLAGYLPSQAEHLHRLPSFHLGGAQLATRRAASLRPPYVWGGPIAGYGERQTGTGRQG